MREELLINAATGEQIRREFTRQEEESADASREEWLEAMAQRERDLSTVRERAMQDPAFAALLRILGVP